MNTRPSSPRARRAAAMFGVDAPAFESAALRHARAAAARLDALLRAGPAGRLILLVGPSGSGKSAALKELASLASHRSLLHTVDSIELARLASRSRPVVDCFRSDVPRALRTLAAFGLADASLFPHTPAELSDGQRWRLALAIAAERVELTPSRAPALLALDEFGSILDRPTASTVARGLRRWLNRLAAASCAASVAPNIIVATAHDDLADALRPDLIATFDLHAPPAIVTLDDTRDTPDDAGVRVREGSIEDYRRLARFHYRAGEPATVVHVLRAEDSRAPNTAAPIGVLVVSMPTLNGRWRDLAWPGRYSGSDRRSAATRLNRELRCVSRVIVDPRRRGSGVATALVREYLRHPLTAATEAVAAMGVCCPFFQRAGMTEYTLAPSERDARLADALATAELTGRDHREPAVAALLTGSSRRGRFVARELRRWAGESRATRAMTNAPIDQLAQAAWSTLAAPLVAYAATEDLPPQRGGRNA